MVKGACETHRYRSWLSTPLRTAPETLTSSFSPASVSRCAVYSLRAPGRPSDRH